MLNFLKSIKYYFTKIKKSLFLVSIFLFSITLFSQNYSYQIALLKYNGGGDWYANLETSLPNLIKYCNQNLQTNINPEQAIVEVSSSDIFNYPLVHITGHGNIILTMAYLKFMNMMVNPLKVLVFIMKEDWFVFTIINVIWAMVGKMKKFTTIV